MVGATRQRVDARQQLFKRKGLGQVIVGAHAQAGHAVFHRAQRGEHQDGQADPRGAQALAHLQATHAGQHHVEQHHRGRVGGLALAVQALRQRQAVGPRAGHMHHMAFGAQAALQKIGHAAVVFHHQNVHAVFPCCQGRRRHTVVPCPALDVRLSEPPCAAARAWASGSPKPVPSARWRRACSPR